jgi:hypothetical protein
MSTGSVYDVLLTLAGVRFSLFDEDCVGPSAVNLRLENEGKRTHIRGLVPRGL